MESNVQAIYKETVQQLAEIYDRAEANAVANVLFEDLFNISKVQRLADPERHLTSPMLDQYYEALSQLLRHRPVQQVVGHCYFFGRKYKVNEHTLIPRPETEELVELILQENSEKPFRILDVGTGTGCIAIALAKEISGAEVHAWDISEKALQIARENATANRVEVRFYLRDVLVHEGGEEKFHIIVSNPPYIPSEERKSMAANVVRYEPGSALFVPDDDPLVFYRKITELGQKSLHPGGKLYFEVHESYGKEVKELLESGGYTKVTVQKDLQGKDRMVKAELKQPFTD